ncbi:hypothetical protein FPV67DRAFT_1462876 [Lyophyllum atratum]|nr:hypothetical protein FPV67DRAFT_1462876 [Lyophyllum atratum]
MNFETAVATTSQLIPVKLRTLLNYPSHLIVSELQARICSSELCIASYALSTSVLLIFLFSFFCTSPQTRTRRRLNAHQALLFVFTPTCAAQPTKYADLLDSLVCDDHSRTIQLSASRLLQSMRAGIFELRNPQDIPDLLLGRLRVYGWRMRLISGFSSRGAILEWILTSQLPSFKFRKDIESSKPMNLLPNTYLPAAIRETLNPSICHFRLDSVIQKEANPTLHLDFITNPYLEATIRIFQSRLKPATLGSLEFTTMASNISFLSNDFILCSLPFTSRKYLQGQTAQRTSTPLLASLRHITECLSSSTSTTTIISIRNITSEHINVLRASRQRLISDRVLRTTLIERWGEEGWREHVFLTDWEAGLLSAGFLTRWSIFIRK